MTVAGGSEEEETARLTVPTDMVPAAYPPGWQPEGGGHHGYHPHQPPRRPTPSADAHKQIVPLGVASFVAGGIVAALLAYRALAALMTAALDEAQRKLLPGNVPPELEKLADRITSTLRTISSVELMSLVPCGLALLGLLVVSVAAMAKRRWAVKSTMGWAGLGLFAAAMTAALQVIYLAPELRALERALTKMTAAAVASPSIAAPTMARTLIPAIVLGLWALVSFGWAWYVDQKLDATV